MLSYAQRHAPPARGSRSPSPCNGASSPRGGASGQAAAAGQAAQGLTRGAEKLLAEGFGACVDRLEAKADALEGQVAQALRKAGLLQDVVGALEARVAVLEVRSPAAGGSLSATLLRGDPSQRTVTPGFGSSAEPSASSRPPAEVGQGPSAGLDRGISRWELPRGADERLQQRFTELREWQADVEDAVRQLSAEARLGAGGVGRGRLSDSLAFAGAGEGDFTFDDSVWLGSDVGEQRLHDLAFRTESRLGQLEDHLSALRREMTIGAGDVRRGEEPLQRGSAWSHEATGPLARSGSAPALRADVAAGAAGGGERPPSRRSARGRATISRLVDELVRLDERGKADPADRSVPSASSALAAAARHQAHGRSGVGVGASGAALVRSSSATGRRISAGSGAPGPVRTRRR